MRDAEVALQTLPVVKCQTTNIHSVIHHQLLQDPAAQHAAYAGQQVHRQTFKNKYITKTHFIHNYLWIEKTDFFVCHHGRFNATLVNKWLQLFYN